jgi:hypothetical protein
MALVNSWRICIEKGEEKNINGIQAFYTTVFI